MRRRWLIAVPIGLVITAALFIGVMRLAGLGSRDGEGLFLSGRLGRVDRSLPNGVPPSVPHIYMKIITEAEFEPPVIIVNSVAWPPKPDLNIRPENYRFDEIPFDQSNIDKLLAQPERPRSARWILLNGSKPAYPAQELQRGTAGYAVIVFALSNKGEVLEIRTKEASGPAFGHAAVKAVRDWRFIPSQQDGKPVASEKVTMRMEFRIDENAH